MHAKSKMTLSIIIPSYKRELLLKKLLSELIKLYTDHQNDVPLLEVIVVDDGSPDIKNKEAMIDSFTFPFAFSLIKQANAGPASARNHGIRHAQGEFIAFLDDDALPQNNWFKEIIAKYNDPQIAGISGRNEALNPQTLTEKFLTHIQHLNAHQYTPEGNISYVCTVNCSFRKEILDDVHGFDETFRYPAGEDMDLSFRIRKKGFRFEYNNNAVVMHKHRQTQFELYKMFFLTGRGTYKCVHQNQNFDSAVTDEFSFSFIKAFRSAKKTLTSIVFSILKSGFKDQKKVFFPIMQTLTLVFYQLGRFYEKIHLKFNK